jgi:hypothetical protein
MLVRHIFISLLARYCQFNICALRIAEPYFTEFGQAATLCGGKL